MRISKRLKTIADLIEEPTLVDVGCDHALLDIYCVKEKHLTCIASDCNRNACKIACSNIQKYGLENEIQVYQTDGTKNIPMTEDSTLVISGMGTSTILHILKESKVLPNQIILQSNNHLEELRRYLVQIGYYMEKEEIVKEKNIFNIILSCKKGIVSYDKLDYEIGPMIRKKRLEEKKDYLLFLIQNEKKILDSLKENQKDYSIHKQKLEQYKNELT